MDKLKNDLKNGDLMMATLSKARLLICPFFNKKQHLGHVVYHLNHFDSDNHVYHHVNHPIHKSLSA